MTGRIIVSRHRGAVEFIARRLFVDGMYTVRSEVGGPWVGVSGSIREPGTTRPAYVTVPVLAEARPEDVRGKVVYGNLPLHLAALAECVHAIEFEGPSPRGAEYTLADMERAEARLARYRVSALAPA